MEIKIYSPVANLETNLDENQVKELLYIAMGYVTGRPAEARPTITSNAEVRQPREERKEHQEDRKPAQQGYKGFLYIKCEVCGEVKGYCIKSHSSKYRCNCGHETPLSDLKPMYVNCEVCGEKFKYMTNITDEVATMNCIHCGSPVDLEYHVKNGAYQTMRRG